MQRFSIDLVQNFKFQTEKNSTEASWARTCPSRVKTDKPEQERERSKKYGNETKWRKEKKNVSVRTHKLTRLNVTFTSTYFLLCKTLCRFILLPDGREHKEKKKWWWATTFVECCCCYCFYCFKAMWKLVVNFSNGCSRQYILGFIGLAVKVQFEYYKVKVKKDT